MSVFERNRPVDGGADGCVMVDGGFIGDSKDVADRGGNAGCAPSAFYASRWARASQSVREHECAGSRRTKPRGSNLEVHQRRIIAIFCASREKPLLSRIRHLAIDQEYTIRVSS